MASALQPASASSVNAYIELSSFVKTLGEGERAVVELRRDLLR